MNVDLLTNLSLFSGAGGLDLGAKLVGGFRTIAYCEWDRYAQGVLMSRIRDGGLDDAPIWDDVSTFDGRPWRGRVDVVSGGFPCQDVSLAGKRAGIEGKRSGLWKEYARILGEVRPRFVLVENVPGLLADGALGVVLGDLAAMGFDAEWKCLSAREFGAPHLRERVFVVAHTERAGLATDLLEAGGDGSSRDKVRNRKGRWGGVRESSGCFGGGVDEGKQNYGTPTAWDDAAGEPAILRMADGLEEWTSQIRCAGNGVVPQQSAPAWKKIRDLAAESNG